MRNQQRAFTLIEVMLAMALTVMVGVIAYSALNVSISTADAMESQAQHLADIQNTVTWLERDIRHAALRGVVDQFGQELPALSGGEAQDYPLQLTRYGWANPQDFRRGELQRVRYQLIDGQLWREYWAVLDVINEDEGKQRLMLLEGVSEFTLRFLDSRSDGAKSSPIGGEWQAFWQPSAADDYLPLAIELVMEIEELGEVRRVIAIAGL